MAGGKREGGDRSTGINHRPCGAKAGRGEGREGLIMTYRLLRWVLDSEQILL